MKVALVLFHNKGSQDMTLKPIKSGLEGAIFRRTFGIAILVRAAGVRVPVLIFSLVVLLGTVHFGPTFASDIKGELNGMVSESQPNMFHAAASAGPPKFSPWKRKPVDGAQDSWRELTQSNQACKLCIDHYGTCLSGCKYIKDDDARWKCESGCRSGRLACEERERC